MEVEDVKASYYDVMRIAVKMYIQRFPTFPTSSRQQVGDWVAGGQMETKSRKDNV